MTGRSEGNGTGYLPENILCLCSACQGNSYSRTHFKSPSNLEYPDIGGTAGNGNVCRDGNGTRKFIKAGSKRSAANIAGAQIEEIGGRSSGRVSICGLH